MPRSRKSRNAFIGACAALPVVTLSAGIAVHAAGLGLKPGLWEVKVVKQVMDGKDMSAQMAAALSQAQQALASLPPEQRARIEAMMNNAGVGHGAGGGGFRICVSPEMAQRDAPVLDKDGRCRPVMLTRHGNQVNFQFNCTTNGTTMQGMGEATITADSVTTHTQMTSTSSTGTHQMQNDTAMTYVSADCGDVKPPQAN